MKVRKSCPGRAPCLTVQAVEPVRNGLKTVPDAATYWNPVELLLF